MKAPTKKQMSFLRIALGMSGTISINDSAAAFILVTQQEMRRLGGKYSLRDACNVQEFVNKMFEDMRENEQQKQITKLVREKHKLK